MNKEFYDKYQKDLDCGSCAGLINCVNDTTPQCLLGTSFYLEDLVDQLQHQLDQQKSMWNELKEWVGDNIIENNDSIDPLSIKIEQKFIAGKLASFEDIKNKMQELEQGEKE